MTILLQCLSIAALACWIAVTIQQGVEVQKTKNDKQKLINDPFKLYDQYLEHNIGAFRDGLFLTIYALLFTLEVFTR